MIRARLALFVAATIVFAPGAGFGDDSNQQPTSDVAARMLAPTFDDPDVAAHKSAAIAKKGKEHGRRLSGAVLALAAVLGAVFVAGSSSRRFFEPRIERRGLHSLTRHRERAPPLLQLA